MRSVINVFVPPLLSPEESESQTVVTVLISKFVGSRWVHTCNVTAYRNAVSLQVTDTIRSYALNFHPVPHGVNSILRALHHGVPSLLREPEQCLCS